MNIEKASSSIAAAIINKDAAKLAEFTVRLLKYPAAEVEPVFEALRLAILASYGITIDGAGEFVIETEDSDADSEAEDDADDESDSDSEDDEIEINDDDEDQTMGMTADDLFALIDQRVSQFLVANKLVEEADLVTPANDLVDPAASELDADLDAAGGPDTDDSEDDSASNLGDPVEDPDSPTEDAAASDAAENQPAEDDDWKES